MCQQIEHFCVHKSGFQIGGYSAGVAGGACRVLRLSTFPSWRWEVVTALISGSLIIIRIAPLYVCTLHINLILKNVNSMCIGGAPCLGWFPPSRISRQERWRRAGRRARPLSVVWLTWWWEDVCWSSVRLPLCELGSDVTIYMLLASEDVLCWCSWSFRKS